MIAVAVGLFVLGRDVLTFNRLNVADRRAVDSALEVVAGDELVAVEADGIARAKGHPGILA